MDLSFTEEQSMLRDTVASFLADRYDFETRRKIAQSDAGWRPDYAHELAPIYFNGRKTSIYGGSNEIQRNIIAKMVLGL